MQIDTNVNEADIGKIREKQDVTFTVDAYPETLFKGLVKQVRNAPIIVQNVVTYDVVIFVDNSDLRLKPGMTVNASIITSKKTGILKIPNSALRFRLPGMTDRDQSKTSGPVGGQSVWALDKMKPKRMRIKTGINDGNYTEVISGDIAEGQDVIVDVIGIQRKQQPVTGPPRMF
jgi:HlyD family secretion protein